MSALDLARAAMIHAQEAIAEHGSNNKLTTLGREMTPQEYGAKITLDSRIAALQSTAPSRGATMAAMVGHGRSAARAGAGNCMELTAIACAYLEQQEAVGPFDAVKLAPPGDHIFAVVGETADGNGDFPSDMTQWDAQAAVCDAWVGISCLAREFPGQWRARMREWALAGVELMIDTSATRGAGTYDRVPPSNPFWMNALDADKGKLSFTWAAPPPRRRRCLLATAACSAMGLAEDCTELQTLREFRDTVLQAAAADRALVARYYRLAPAVLERLTRRPHAGRLLAGVYRRTVLPAVAAIRAGDEQRARTIFLRLLASMEASQRRAR